MSDLRGRVTDATTAAMKARDKQRVAALRLVGADLKRIEVDERRQLTDVDVIGVLNRMLKQRNDSESQFRAAGRTDLADQEAYEITVIKEFLPAALSDAELDATIRETISPAGPPAIPDIGTAHSPLPPSLPSP